MALQARILENDDCLTRGCPFSNEYGGGKFMSVFLTVTCLLDPAHPAYTRHGRGHTQTIYSACFPTAHSLSLPHNFSSTSPIHVPISLTLPLHGLHLQTAKAFSPAQPKARRGLLPPRKFAGSLCPTGSAPCSVYRTGKRTLATLISSPSIMN